MNLISSACTPLIYCGSYCEKYDFTFIFIICQTNSALSNRAYISKPGTILSMEWFQACFAFIEGFKECYMISFFQNQTKTHRFHRVWAYNPHLFHSIIRKYN